MYVFALVVGLVLTAIGLFRLYSILWMNKAKFKKISELSTSSIDKAIVFGTVLPDKTILSPITQTPCVFCKYETIENTTATYNGRVNYDHFTVMGATGRAGTNFLLRDETSTIELNSEMSYDFYSIHDQQYQDGDKKYGDKIVRFKEKYNVDSLLVKNNLRRRNMGLSYHERLVLPGDQIWVLCKTKPGETPKAVEIYSKNPKEQSDSVKSIALTSIVLVFGLIVIGVAFVF